MIKDGGNMTREQQILQYQQLAAMAWADGDTIKAQHYQNMIASLA